MEVGMIRAILPSIRTVAIFIVGIVASLASPVGAQEGVDSETEARIRGLVEDLGSDEWSVREGATEELIAIGRSATPFLLAARREIGDIEVTLRIARVLRATGGWVDDPEEIQRQVGGKLDRLRGQPIFAVRSWDPEQVDLVEGFYPVVEELRQIGPALGEALIGSLDDPAATPVFRANLAFLLGTMNVTAGAEPLVDMLDDSDDLVRIAAARSLGVLAQAETVGALCERARAETDTPVRMQVILALSGMRVEAAVDGLIDLLDDPEPEVRQVAIYALGRATGVAHGYNPFYPAERRARGVARWRSWWDQQRGSFVFPARPEADDRSVIRARLQRGNAVPRQLIPGVRRAIPAPRVQRVPAPRVQRMPAPQRVVPRVVPPPEEPDDDEPDDEGDPD
jgi:hypothetical protein